MALLDVFSPVVEQIGAAAIVLRGQDGRKLTPATGSNPAIPLAKAQGSIPTLKMPTAKGWSRGRTPSAAPGLKVNAFATDLKHPRWICVLPNGDVLVAEALSPPDPVHSLFDYAMAATMKRAAAMGDSPNRITLLRDADGDGVAETKNAFMEGLNQPFGMALVGDTFYVGNTDGVVAVSRHNGREPHRRGPRTQTDQTQWRRALKSQPALSPDKTKLYVIGVGSLTNITDKGMEIEKGRAAISEPTSQAERAASSPPACVIPWASPGNPTPARYGLWSTSATASRDETPPRLPHFRSRRRLLRLALLLLGQDGG